MIHFDKPSVAILAGGLGTRLRAAVGDRPKVLAPIGGRPFLYRLLDQLWCFAIREVVLLVGHGTEQVRETLGESYHGMKLWYSREPHPLGTAGAVRRALPFLHAPDVLLFNGDSFCEVDLDAFRQHHDDTGATASLVLCRVPDASRYGRVELDGERVVSLVEKGSAGGAAWINAGVYLLRRDRIAAWPEGPLSLERDILPECVAAGGVSGFRAGGRFLDIGTPESYASAEGFFAALEAA